MWPFPNFHLLIFKNSILLICLVHIVLLLFISCLLIYMLNYLLLLSMVHEYAHFYEYICKPVYCGICLLSGAVVTDKAGVQPRPQAKPSATAFGL